ncbi:MAG: HD domain-containing protein [Planctomycetota bacterium]|jgi:hypothetical protein
MPIKKFTRELRKFVTPFYDGRNASHDFEHVERILARVREWKDELIGEIDEQKLTFLALFHGLRTLIEEDKNFHERVAQNLEKQGLDRREIDDYFEALTRHEFSPVGPEEMLVADANSWEAVGLFGIAKWFTRGGAVGQSYEETIRQYEQVTLNLSFHLDFVRDRAEPKVRASREYFERLKEEIGFGDETPPADEKPKGKK